VTEYIGTTTARCPSCGAAVLSKSGHRVTVTCACLPKNTLTAVGKTPLTHNGTSQTKVVFQP